MEIVQVMDTPDDRCRAELGCSLPGVDMSEGMLSCVRRVAAPSILFRKLAGISKMQVCHPVFISAG